MALYKKISPGLVLLFASHVGFAADKALLPEPRPADSLLPINARYIQQADVAPDLLEAEADYEQSRDQRKGLRRLLKVIKIKRLIADSRRGYRLYTHLARFSARLKMYPLAMKFYSKASEYRMSRLLSWYQSPVFGRAGVGDPVGSGPGVGSSAGYGDGMDSSVGSGDAGDADGVALADSSTYSFLEHMDSLPSLAVGGAVGGAGGSLPVEVQDLRRSFDDGKTAVSYALILHDKQPVPGKRRSFTHINNVGHMFITLIKYNADGSFIARSFGFYPHKKNIFSATPLHVRSPSVFKDDALHDWDESIGKFISGARFDMILGLLARYDHTTYNLNRNNCTDFGLHVASLAGISIDGTRGSWPLGKGNNPGNAGQSMLEGKFRDMDGGGGEGLFVCNKVGE